MIMCMFKNTYSCLQCELLHYFAEKLNMCPEIGARIYVTCQCKIRVVEHKINPIILVALIPYYTLTITSRNGTL